MNIRLFILEPSGQEMWENRSGFKLQCCTITKTNYCHESNSPVSQLPVISCNLARQHALRLMAFGQIYKVLEMEPLPSNKQPQKYPWCDKEGGRSCLSRLGCIGIKLVVQKEACSLQMSERLVVVVVQVSRRH